MDERPDFEPNLHLSQSPNSAWVRGFSILSYSTWAARLTWPMPTGTPSSAARNEA